jgi:hypothetical protein
LNPSGDKVRPTSSIFIPTASLETLTKSHHDLFFN